VPDLPDGIALERNRDLVGWMHSPWIRRVILCCIAVLPVLALLNVFGQHPTTSSASSPAVSVNVTAPARLRSGLIFQVRTQVLARRDVGQLQIAFDKGWWESMSVNSIVPEPTEESSENGRVVLSYGKLPAGQTLVSWIYFMVNPTNVGKRTENIDVLDGSNVLVHIHRALTIFP
jgi:Mn2+/Fe2+ NRAMP family transporter